MSFSQENGYIPVAFNTLMSTIREGINTQFGTSYTEETFVGTGWYKYAYSIVQKIQENEVKTSEIFQKLQQYISLTNESIDRPSVSYPGLIAAFQEQGFIVSVKPPLEANAGKIFICADIADTISGKQGKGYFDITSYANLVSGTHDKVTVGATDFTAQSTSVTPGAGTFQAATSNAATAISLAAQINAHATAGALVVARAFGARVVINAIARGTASIALGYTDNDSNIGATKSGTALTGGTAAAGAYPAQSLIVGGLIKDYVAAGLVSEGTEEEDITLSNGQEFPFKFYLPDRISTKLRLTVNASENSTALIPTDEELRQKVFDNSGARYRLGYNFEPQRYFGFEDAEWTESLILEYSWDGGTTWSSTVYDSLFNEVFDFLLSDIQVVVNM